ncbi:hypothetical protein BGZ83_004499 [Gryganskiella cystojenkinii]|nr:hypothetical protein BGZ83_004499 [Gryganskiella cystojenkinii]
MRRYERQLRLSRLIAKTTALEAAAHFYEVGAATVQKSKEQAEADYPKAVSNLQLSQSCPDGVGMEAQSLPEGFFERVKGCPILQTPAPSLTVGTENNGVEGSGPESHDEVEADYEKAISNPQFPQAARMELE